MHETIEGFADRLRDKLEATPPLRIVSRKNPYLFRLRAGENAAVFASIVVDAFLSSSEETIFGKDLEQIAIGICQQARGGKGAGIESIDLEYGDQSSRNVVQIKSGPNWGNSSQRKALETAFKTAARR